MLTLFSTVRSASSISVHSYLIKIFFSANTLAVIDSHGLWVSHLTSALFIHSIQQIKTICNSLCLKYGRFNKSLKLEAMNKGNIEYINLEELSNTDYKIIDGETDITGWTVVDESEAKVGKVRDLLFDPEQNAIRYLIVDLDEGVLEGEEKAILLPIGITTLAGDKKQAVIPAMHREQFVAMPQYIIGEITRDTELRIRSAIGSPAALRIEEEIAEMDPSEFYNHHHFDRGNLGYKTSESYQAPSQQGIASENRQEEQHTIHELIESSAVHPVNNAENTHELSDPLESFDVQTDHGIFSVEPQENGMYRIFNNGEKLGVIYPEPGERGVQWRTMDHFQDRFVEVIGEAITQHHNSTSQI